MGWLVWILTTIFTGFLIGLGGPFWFDMVKRLSVVSQVTGSLMRPPPAEGEGHGGTRSPKSATALLPEDAKTAFKTAVRAQRIIDSVGAAASDFLGPKALRL
jgi:hypothetical protein